MKILENGKIKSITGSVVTLGNFDGLHIGHRRILKRVIRRARELRLPSVLYTFDPHPLKVIRPEKSPPLITTREAKALLIEETGIEYLVFAHFTAAFASKHPRQFAEEVLAGELSAREVIVGHDYAFGREKRGTIEHLSELGTRLGFTVSVVDACKKGGGVISSSRIRGLILRGALREAAGLLGRDFTLSGTVVRGEGVGAKIGYPTANIETGNELIPPTGIYAVYVTIEGTVYRGVANIGTSPTFKDREFTIEAHILDFSGDIYGKTITLSFIRRLRGEKKFNSVTALVKRIEQDILRAEKILTK